VTETVDLGHDDLRPEDIATDADETPTTKPSELRRLASHLHLNGWTFGLAFVTLVIVVVVVVTVDHLPSYLRTHTVNPWLVGLAALVAYGQYVGFTISLAGACSAPLPTLRTFQLEVAESLTTMATPESIGSLALTMRYLARRSLEVADAAAAAGLSSFLTTAVGFLVVPIGAIFAASSLNVSQLKKDVPSGGWEIIVAVIALAVVITLAIKLPRFRAKLAAFGRKIGTYLRTIAEHPTRGLTICAGEVVTLASQLVCMVLILGSLHLSANIAALVVITQLAGAASNVVPIPGGLGAPEAILIAGLSSVGIHHQEAIIAAIFYRMFTYWLPPVPGSIALFDLRRRRLV
jgi:undecaprenyl-diphosphatase